jgi:hypothetical protein
MPLRMRVTNVQPIINGSGLVRVTVGVFDDDADRELPTMGKIDVTLKASEVKTALATGTAIQKRAALSLLIVTATPSLDKTLLQAMPVANKLAIAQAANLVDSMQQFESLPLADAPVTPPEGG